MNIVTIQILNNTVAQFLSYHFPEYLQSTENEGLLWSMTDDKKAAAEKPKGTEKGKMGCYRKKWSRTEQTEDKEVSDPQK